MSDGGIDIAKVVSLIMENPRLIEEISAMAKKEATPEEPPPKEIEAPDERTAEPAAHQVASSVAPSGRNRSRLLGALKPYVSKDRAQAIDSMLTIVEILDAMKGR